MSIEYSGDYVDRAPGDFDREEMLAQEAMERFLALLDDALDDSPEGKRNRWTNRWFDALRYRRY